jgi:crotonobetainyl-CoA:carnitine CoA-transferase CaiB-like acyl-CoA transferase
LHARYPQISQAAIVGYPPPDDDRPGHDLGYQARSGLVQPPHLPIALIADLAGAQEAVTAVLGLLLARQRGGEAGFVQVSLAEAASRFAEPLRYGLTLPEGELGGRLPGYNLYRCRRGWVAVTALETQLYTRLSQELGLSRPTRQALAEVFARRPATEWEDWAVLRGLPLVAVRDVAGNLYVGEGSCHD